MSSSSIAVLVVAAGRGERAGDPGLGPKQYRHINGRSVIRRTLDAFLEAGLNDIVVVLHRDDDALLIDALDGLSRPRTIVGGSTRQDSVRLGLEALAAEAPDIVLIHDAARPFVSAAIIGNVVNVVRATGGGALPGLPLTDTLKRAAISTPNVAETIPRDGLFAAQTPQGFPFRAIFDAHRDAASLGRTNFTDDASIAEWHGIGVTLVEGSGDNFKLTRPEDFIRAGAMLSGNGSMIDVRTGNGYDVHQLVDGDHVTLCGVRIAHDKALSGHSDADVGLHALTDALLATCGAGDIGDHFPPSDMQWRGAASHIFVRRAVAIVAAAGGRIMNADISLICEAPKIAPHRDDMRKVISEMTGLDLTRVSVKATTNETIGFVGRREGIAAIATASVSYGERA